MRVHHGFEAQCGAGRPVVRRWWRPSWRLAACGGLTALLLASSAGLAVPTRAATRVQTPLQKGLAFYRGKALTLVAASAAGGVYDVIGRIMVPYLDAYLHATVNVEDNGNGNGIGAADQTAASAPNGLTLGYMNLSSSLEDVLLGQPGVDFNPLHEAFLGGTPGPDSFLCAIGTSHITTFAQLKAQSAAAKFLSPASGSSYLQTKLVVDAFGLASPIIEGYANQNAVIQGFLRGDGQIVYNAAGAVGPIAAAHQCTLIADAYTPPRQNEYYGLAAHVPSMAELSKRFPGRTATERQAQAGLASFSALATLLLFVPGGTPGYLVTTLRAALEATLKNPGFVAQMSQAAEPTGYVSGTQVKANYILGLKKTFPALLRVTGLLP